MALQLNVVSVATDIGAAGVFVASLAGVLPPIAALLAIVWYCIQIWESKTTRTHIRLWRMQERKRRARRPTQSPGPRTPGPS